MLLGIGLPFTLANKSQAQMPTPEPTDVLYYSWQAEAESSNANRANPPDGLIADTAFEPETAPADASASEIPAARSDEPVQVESFWQDGRPATHSASELNTPDTTSQTPAPDPSVAEEPLETEESLETEEPPVEVELDPDDEKILFDGVVPSGSGQTIAAIEVRFLNKEGETVEGHTRPSVFTREIGLEPGTAYDEVLAQQGLDRISRLRIVEEADIELEPAADPDQVNMIVLVRERSPIVLGLFSVRPAPTALEGPFQQSSALGQGPHERTGISADGSVSFLNIAGNDQELTLQVRGGEQVFNTELLFRDPWIGEDPTGIAFNIFNQRSVQSVFSGGDRDVDLPNRNTPWVHRFGGGVEVFRPVTSDLTFALGVNYQQISIHNSAFESETFDRDELGERLIVGSDFDELLTVQFAGELNRLDNLDDPLDGDRLRFSVDQSIPIGDASITYTRLSTSYTYFLPLDLFGFAEGPRTLVVNAQAGVMFGDVPPYDAFNLDAGPLGYSAASDLAVGSRFALIATEYRFPIVNFDIFRRDVNLGGAIFGGFASTLGSADEVIGDPSVNRQKSEDGVVFGLGLRARTDFGLFRLEFSINDDGDSQVVLTAGEKF